MGFIGEYYLQRTSVWLKGHPVLPSTKPIWFYILAWCRLSTNNYKTPNRSPNASKLCPFYNKKKCLCSMEQSTHNLFYFTISRDSTWQNAWSIQADYAAMNPKCQGWPEAWYCCGCMSELNKLYFDPEVRSLPVSHSEQCQRTFSQATLGLRLNKGLVPKKTYSKSSCQLNEFWNSCIHWTASCRESGGNRWLWISTTMPVYVRILNMGRGEGAMKVFGWS